LLTNRRPRFFDAFRIVIATGATALHRERNEPGAIVLLDRDGEPTFRSALADDGTVEFSAFEPGTGGCDRWSEWAARSTRWGVLHQQVTAVEVDDVDGDRGQVGRRRPDRSRSATNCSAEPCATATWWWTSPRSTRSGCTSVTVMVLLLQCRWSSQDAR
jgi:hypothetical protein